MQKQIISDTVVLDRPEKLDTLTIEELLAQNFDSLLRWAIVETNQNSIKICVTYEV